MDKRYTLSRIGGAAILTTFLVLPGSLLAGNTEKSYGGGTATTERGGTARTEKSTGKPFGTNPNSGRKNCSTDVHAKNFDPYCGFNRTQKYQRN